MKLWIDVEDLFHYAHRVRRPSGIQRLAFELQRAFVDLAPDQVGFVRHGKYGTSFVSVPFSAVEALFTNLADYTLTNAEQAAPPPVVEDSAEPAVEISMPASVPVLARPSLARRLRHRALAAMPPEIREPAIRVWIKLSESIHASIDLGIALFRYVVPRKPAMVMRAPPPVPPAPLPDAVEKIAVEKPAEDVPSDFDRQAAPGDWLVVLGSPWSYPDYAMRISTHCQRHGLKFAVLLYDIIPIRRPEWVDKSLREVFYAWFHSVVPLADKVFAISQTTAMDVERYERETRFGLRTRVLPVPLGTGFGRPPAPTRTRRLPPPRRFALIVSTIEARKNHLLLFRIWRELSEQVPGAQLPILVFAGRVGWLVADLMQQLENTNWLDGKIMLVDSPTDGELAALYDDCLFTLYPSFYEGWGLPVTESLIYGAPCLASNRTSLPEAGGPLVDYFDPDNLHEAVAAVRRYIDTPALLAPWRERIAREFRHIPWTETAASMLAEMRAEEAEQVAAE
jgi:glycosyltransferase involved in cell wall biosynthesis